jgi:hypothetical protein
VARVVEGIGRFLDDRATERREQEEEAAAAAHPRRGDHEHGRHRGHQYHHAHGRRPPGGGDEPRRGQRRDHEHIARLLHQRYGIDAPTARWLASSFKDEGFGFDVGAARDLLRNLPLHDFWGQLGAVLASGGTRVDLVAAGRNPAWTPPTLRRLGGLADEFPGRLGVHRLESAGHWVHADDLEGLLALMRTKA